MVCMIIIIIQFPYEIIILQIYDRNKYYIIALTYLVQDAAIRSWWTFSMTFLYVNRVMAIVSTHRLSCMMYIYGLLPHVQKNTRNASNSNKTIFLTLYTTCLKASTTDPYSTLYKLILCWILVNTSFSSRWRYVGMKKC